MFTLNSCNGRHMQFKIKLIVKPCTCIIILFINKIWILSWINQCAMFTSYTSLYPVWAKYDYGWIFLHLNVFNEFKLYFFSFPYWCVQSTGNKKEKKCRGKQGIKPGPPTKWERALPTELIRLIHMYMKVTNGDNVYVIMAT